MIITIDTNVYVSAFVYGGMPAQLLRFRNAGRIRLAISQPILDEIARIMKGKFDWSDQRCLDLVGSLRRQSEVLVPEFSLRVVQSDPSDDRIIECAVASNSAFIVSGDKHLRTLGQYQGIRVVTVAEMVTMLS